MVKIKIKLLDKSLPFPKYSHKGDAGLDLFSSIDCAIKPYERKLVPTGIKVAIPKGYAGFVQPRSGLAIKHGISLVNSPGLIDSGYRGEICIIMINFDKDNEFNIRKGDKICQLVIQKVDEAILIEVDDIGKSDRGEGGFGSTGL
ncbi:MAG: dUTP diphosphatase [Actinobacteria bacterium]|nr:dUTP diphosphatase [Actinomycetota bacterium]